MWLSKNLVDLCTTLQIISISLYKIEGFYFTYYQHFTLQIISISTINLQSGSSTTQLMVWFANPSNHQKNRNYIWDFIELRAAAEIFGRVFFCDIP